MVSTRVGGIPEVLPPDLITLATPTVQGKPIQAGGLKVSALVYRWPEVLPPPQARPCIIIVIIMLHTANMTL